MEGMGRHERKEMRVAEAEYAGGMGVPEARAEESEKSTIDQKIAALREQIQKGREFIAQTTNAKMIDVAEAAEARIAQEIAELEKQKKPTIN